MDAIGWQILTDVAQAVFTLAIGIYSWHAHRDRARVGEVGALRDGQAKLTEEVTRITESLRHVPSPADVTRISENLRHLPTSVAMLELSQTINEMRGEVRTELGAVTNGMSALEGRMSALEHRINRHEEYLLTGVRP